MHQVAPLRLAFSCRHYGFDSRADSVPSEEKRHDLPAAAPLVCMVVAVTVTVLDAVCIFSRLQVDMLQHQMIQAAALAASGRISAASLHYCRGGGNKSGVKVFQKVAKVAERRIISCHLTPPTSQQG